MSRRTCKEAQVNNKIPVFFFCTLAGWWGILVVFRAVERGCGLDCVAILHNVSLYAFFSLIVSDIRFIQKSAYNYALCKHSFGLFFSGTNQVRWWRSRNNRDKSPYLMSFLPCAWTAQNFAD